MSHFSDVDASPSADRLVTYLERTDHWMSTLKAYMAAAFARDVPGGLILDLGCGLGRDLQRLETAGLRAVGIDLSATLLTHAAAAAVTLVQGDAAVLPFRDDTFDGCRAERTLQHVSDPGAVLDEIARVTRPGGTVAILDPDYSQFRVESDLVPHGTWPAALLTARNPNLGGEVAALLEARGFRVRDVVVETSHGNAVANLPVDAETVVIRAVADGRCDRWLADAWLEEQRARSAAGTFRAHWNKVIVIASMRQ
jgi:SAM-dependent methyltransferase